LEAFRKCTIISLSINDAEIEEESSTYLEVVELEQGEGYQTRGMVQMMRCS